MNIRTEYRKEGDNDRSQRKITNVGSESIPVRLHYVYV